MRHIRAALARIVGLFTADRAQEELRSELQAHLDMETAELIRRGLPPDEARRRALLASGGLTQAAEAIRDQRGMMAAIGIVACWIPALRAARIDPVISMRA
jgi:putative ABC transport system permease protein